MSALVKLAAIGAVAARVDDRAGASTTVEAAAAGRRTGELATLIKQLLGENKLGSSTTA
jgi:hypothetical protein